MILSLCDKKDFCCYYEKRKHKVNIGNVRFNWDSECYFVDRWDENGKYYHIQWNKNRFQVWYFRKYISQDWLMYIILNIKIINSPDRTLKGGGL